MYGIIMYYFTNVGLIYMDSFDLYGLPGNTTHYIKKLTFLHIRMHLFPS